MENKLGTKLAGEQQRFYFDKNSGEFYDNAFPGLFAQRQYGITQRRKLAMNCLHVAPKPK
jgi:hypothetical protein